MSDDRLRLLLERAERLREELAGIRDDLRDVFAEAKAVGYDGGLFRQLLKRRAMPPDARAEADAVLATYEDALGMASEPKALTLPKRRWAASVLDGDLADQLRALVREVLEMRAERRDMTAAIAARLKVARGQGFDGRKVTEVCMWLERCDKHGQDAMLAAEDLFLIYREAAEMPGELKIEGDRKLVEMFAAPAETKAPPKRLKTLSAQRAAAEAARRARNGEF